VLNAGVSFSGQNSSSYVESIVFRSVFNALSIKGSLIAAGLLVIAREGDLSRPPNS